MEREKASGAGTSKWSNRLLLPSYSHPGTSRAGGPGHRGGAGVYSTEEEPDDVLPGFVMEALAEHVEKWPPGDFELIFLDRNRHPVRRSTFYRRWRQATERAGLPGFKVHNLRHTAPHWRWQAEPILST
jgi:hypothetical protein